jgi:hypothetical protein
MTLNLAIGAVIAHQSTLRDGRLMKVPQHKL